MNYQHENVNESLSGNSDTDESYRYYEPDEETEAVKLQLLECQSKCEDIAKELCDVDQLKDKGTFVLKDVVRKYNDLDEELYKIHCNYIKCAEKIDAREEYINQKIHSLTLQRDKLKKELSELKAKTDENGKTLTKFKKMIEIQENKNAAQIRKLRKQMENKRITPNLKEKINTILNDPRVTNTKNSKQ